MMEAIIGFLRAALPWGAVGLLWAVFFAKNAGKEKRKNSLTIMEPRGGVWGCALEQPSPPPLEIIPA